MQQCMELTRTNRSCGLTTYFFRTLELDERAVYQDWADEEHHRRRQQGFPPLLRGAPGEGLSHRIDRLPARGLLTQIWTLQ